MSDRKDPVMVVVYTGKPTAYALRVEGKIVGRDDLLGIENPLEPVEPVGILGIMVRAGADRGKAARFLRDLKKKQDERRAAGRLLHVSSAFDPDEAS